MNRANFHQFKGSDWQRVAVRPTTIKADLYSLALSPSAISQETVWSSQRRNFTELHLVLNEDWATHTHTYLPLALNRPLMHLRLHRHVGKWRWGYKKENESHAIMFIISIGGLIEMSGNQEITVTSFGGIRSNGFVSSLSADNCPSDVRRKKKLCQVVHSETCRRHLIVFCLWLQREQIQSLCQIFPLWLRLTSQSVFG